MELETETETENNKGRKIMFDSAPEEKNTLTPEETKDIQSSCPLVYALNVFGGKWKLQIIWILANKPLRFGELKRELHTISEKILIQQLKQMEEHELINRKMYAQVPPKVEYSLTHKSVALLPVLKDLLAWSKEHIVPIRDKVRKGKAKEKTDIVTV